MIKDKLENAEVYYPLSERLKLGFMWLKSTDLENIFDGRYVIDGNDIYANVQSYETKDDALFEAHREYIDIQYMIKGCETIGVSNYLEGETVEEYNKEKDIEFLNCKGSDNLTLKEEEFVILYPQDAHKPSIKYNKKQNVKKVVVKVSIK